MNELALMLHAGNCVSMSERCGRYIPGNKHYDFYQELAERLVNALEPLIGRANIIPVIRVVLDEMW